MDLTKYEQIPIDFATAKQIGLSAQTLAAFVRRGMAEVLPGSPNKYRKIENNSIKVYLFLEKNKNKIDKYFALYNTNENIGMLCSLSNNEVVDCWGKKYDLQKVYSIRINNEIYKI